MVPGTGSSHAHRRAHPRQRRPALAHRRVHRYTCRPRRVAQTPITAQRLCASWSRALDRAGEAAGAAYEVKALSRDEIGELQRRIREERLWLARFEREARGRFP